MPSQAISDINPNSLGPLEPIRPPQVQMSAPNPLNVAPYFQAQQTINQRRQMDQQDAHLAFYEKKLDYERSQFLYEQTQEILNMNDSLFGEIYSQNSTKARNRNAPAQGQGGGGGLEGSLGLNLNHASHKRVYARHSKVIDDLREQQEKAYAGLIGNKSFDVLNSTKHDLKTALSKARQAIISDPEYMKYATHEKAYQDWLERLAVQHGDQKSVDLIKMNAIQDKYFRYVNGEGNASDQIRNEGVIKDFNNLEFFEDMVYDGKQGDADFKALLAEAYKPIQQSRSKLLPGGNGTIVEEKFTTLPTDADVLPGLIQAAGANPNIRKRIENVTQTSYTTKEGQDELVKYVTEYAAFKRPPSALQGNTYVTDMQTLYIPPQEKLKNSSSTGASAADQSQLLIPNAATEGERAVNSYGLGKMRSGLDQRSVTEDQIRSIIDVRSKNRDAIQEITNPDGSVTVNRLKIDKDGNVVVEIERDEDGEIVLDAEGKPKPLLDKDGNSQPIIAEAIATFRVLPERSTGSNTQGIKNDAGSVRYKNTQGQDVISTPTMTKGELGAFMKKADQIKDTSGGQASSLVLASEPDKRQSLSQNTDGDTGRYQFDYAHQREFLKSIGKNAPSGSTPYEAWQTAYSSMTPQEFAQKEDQYFKKNIEQPALNYLSTAFKKAGISKDRFDAERFANNWQYTADKSSEWDHVLEFVASTANQSGGFRKILDEAASNFAKTSSRGLSINPEDFAKELYNSRVAYIMTRDGARARSTFRDKWDVVGVNRPFQEYVTVLSRINAARDEDTQVPELTKILNGENTRGTGSQPTTQPATGDVGAAPDNVNVPTATSAPVETSADRIISQSKPTDEDFIAEGKRLGIVDVTINLNEKNPLLLPLSTNEKELKIREEQIYKKNLKLDAQGKDIIKKEDDSVYKKISGIVNKQRAERKAKIDVISGDVRTKLIQEKYKDESKQSFEYTAGILEDTMRSQERPIDLENLSSGKIKGTITESERYPDNYHVVQDGSDVITLEGRAELVKWIEDNLAETAFYYLDPLTLVKKEKASVPTTPQTAKSQGGAPAKTKEELTSMFEGTR